MNQISKSKIWFYCITISSFLMIYYLVFKYIDSDFISLLYALIIIYTLYIVMNIIELILFKIIMKYKIKYLVIYPFSYDGRLSFKPFRLSMNQETISDSLTLNLVDKVDNINIKREFYKMFILRKLSIIITAILSNFILIYVFYIDISIYIILITCLFLVLSFFKCNIQYYGQEYLYLYTNNISEYFYKAKCIEILSLEQYHDFVVENNFNKEFTALVLQNYLYKCFSLKNTSIDVEILDKYIREVSNKKKYENIINDINILNIIKLIGLIGKYTNNKNYTEYCILKLNNYLDEYLIDLPMINRYENPIHDYIEFLENDYQINLKKHLLFDIVNIFSYIDNIEQEMIKYSIDLNK